MKDKTNGFYGAAPPIHRQQLVFAHKDLDLQYVFTNMQMRFSPKWRKLFIASSIDFRTQWHTVIVGQR